MSDNLDLNMSKALKIVRASFKLDEAQTEEVAKLIGLVASDKRCAYYDKVVNPPYLWFGFEDVGTEVQKVFCSLQERDAYYTEAEA